MRLCILNWCALDFGEFDMFREKKQIRSNYNIRRLRREILEDRRVLASISFSAIQVIDKAAGANEPTALEA